MKANLPLGMVFRSMFGRRWGYSHRFPLGMVLIFLYAMFGFSPMAVAMLLSPPYGHDTSRGSDTPPVSHPIYYYLRSVPSTEESSPEMLLHAFMERHTSRDYAGAAEMALRLIEAAADRPEGYYNLACSSARLHRYDEAVDALEMAVEKGWRNLVHIRLDPDLSSIRNHAGYRQLLGKLKRLIKNERIIRIPLRTDDWSQSVADLDLQIPSLLKRYHVPGVTIALVRDAELVWTEAYGVSDVQSGEAMNTDHGFKLGAPAHLFALLAALQVQSRGGYSVARIITQGMEYDRQDPARIAGQISDRPTAYVLGVTRSSTKGRPAKKTAYFDRIERDDPAGWPSFKPRTTNFMLLQSAVEELSHQTFFTYCRLNLFDPLLLDSTKFLLADEGGENPVTGHTRLGTPIESVVDKRRLNLIMYTTAPDLGRLLEAMFLDKELAKGDRLLPDGLISESLGTVALKEHGLGLGVQIQSTQDGLCMQLADNIGGMGVLMRWYPRARSGVVVMFNSETGPEAALHIAHLALGGQ